jgi:hypothetical protein
MLPQHILNMFARIPPDTTIENKCYGVYNKLHNGIFEKLDYTIEPQYALPGAFQVQASSLSVTTISRFVAFVITFNEHPILFLEIMPPNHVNFISTRVDADTRMRSRFWSFYELALPPKLHGISVLGQLLDIYPPNSSRR